MLGLHLNTERTKFLSQQDSLFLTEDRMYWKSKPLFLVLSNLVRVVVGVVRTPCDLKSIENWSRKRRHYKLNGIAIARIRMFPFSSFSSYLL